MLRARRVLDLRSSGPDRFPDDPNVPVGVGVRDRQQHLGDDPARVAAGDGHVQQLDPSGVGAQRVTEQPQPRSGGGHRDRDVRGESLADERHNARQILPRPLVEQSRVSKAPFVLGDLNLPNAGCPKCAGPNTARRRSPGVDILRWGVVSGPHHESPVSIICLGKRVAGLRSSG